MDNKAEFSAWIFIILGVILFFFSIEYLLYAVFFICVGVSIGFVKGIWQTAGWASKKIG